jgi:hypothetical protein
MFIYRNDVYFFSEYYDWRTFSFISTRELWAYTLALPPDVPPEFAHTLPGQRSCVPASAPGDTHVPRDSSVPSPPVSSFPLLHPPRSVQNSRTSPAACRNSRPQYLISYSRTVRTASDGPSRRVCECIQRILPTHFDMNIDPVQKRTRYSLLIFRHGRGCTVHCLRALPRQPHGQGYTQYFKFFMLSKG